VSAFTEEGSRRALEAIEAGAVDVVAKPTGKGAEGLLSMIDALAESVVGASRADVKKFRFQGGSAAVASRRGEGAGTVRHASGKIIAIGASTGGTVALKEILPQFPVDTPPILVVQHMPAGFTRLFAESLDKVCMMRVKEAADGDGLERGVAYVAPGDFHMRLAKERGAYRIALSSTEKVNGHRPSVDILFSSVAQAAGKEGVGLILTGMGKDGARGMLEMRCAGARCLAQDEASSVVFGMPKEAYALGGAERFVALEKAVGEVLASVSEGG
jgi:two-component system chemotaxis response regulator CheB